MLATRSALPRALLVLSLVAALAPAPALAQAARYIPYQGHLEEDGAAVGHAVSITFTLYDAIAGGSALYSESDTITPVNGAFSTRIGPVPDSAFAAPSLYLAIAVGDVELGGRHRIETSPYAIRGQPGAPFHVDALTLEDGASAITLSPDPAGDGLSIDNGAESVTLRPATSFGREALAVSDLVLGHGIQTPRLAAHPAIESSPLNHFGSGSLSGTFSDPGGTIVLLASASAWTQSAPGRIHVAVQVDGVTVGSLRGYTASSNTHTALPSAFIRLDRLQFPPGTSANPITRTVTLRPVDCGPSNSLCSGNIVTARADQNDFGNVMVLRLPTP